MDHLESVVKINNLITNNFCKEVINSYKQFKLEHLATHGGLNKNQRNVLGCGVDPKKDVFDKIKKEIERLYVYYQIKFPFTESTKINQIDLLKYEVGGKYEYHVDNYTDYSRTVSVIINLNEEYKGGDLIFTDQNKFEIKRCKLQTGSIVFFPSNFMYPHGIEPITEGTRYSIVAWLQ